MRHTLTIATVCLVFVSSLPLAARHASAENWPGWRGPRGDGSSLEKNVPIHWDGAKAESIVWKTVIPGKGHASPIVWEDRIFTASCREETGDRIVLCVDRRSGRVLWEKTVIQAPLEPKHRLNSYASSTPATDGQRVYVTFAERDKTPPKTDVSATAEKRKPAETVDPCQMVVAAYDFQGQQQWLARPGRFVSKHGFCSPPVLFENLVIVNGDHDGDSYLVALDRATGKTVWKTPREYKTRSYCPPIIRDIDGRTQMVLTGSLCVASYDPRSGAKHWIIRGPTEQFVASMVYNGKLLLMTAGFPEFHTMAIRPDGRGDVTDSHIVWRTMKGCAYVPSPILGGGGKYFLVVSDTGIATCFEAADGKPYWTERIGKHYSASAVEAEGLVHLLSDDGVTTIVRPGEKFEKVAENRLDEACYASPAISQGHIYFRSEKHLVAVGGNP